MNLIFLTLIDLSNFNKRGIYQDLLRKFKDEGNNVYVIHPLERRKKVRTRIEKQNDITFLGVQTLNIQKTNIIEKGVGTILLERQFLKAFHKFFSEIKFDLVLYSTPPITLTRIINFVKQKDNAVSYLLLKDIFPQNAVDLGMIKKSGILYSLFRKKERELYKSSDYIGCMSRANVDYVLKHNPDIPIQKIEVNPNSIEPVSFILSREEKKRIKEKYSIPENAIVFIYGGNLGRPQGVDFMMKAIESSTENENLFFIIVGDGTEYSKIQNWHSNGNIRNVRLMKGLPKNDYDNLLRSCDVGLIFLDHRFTIPNFPSRLLSYLENSMPVIAATDINTDLGKILKQNNAGLWIEAGDLEGFNEAIKEFLGNPSKINVMGKNGRDLLLREFSVSVSYNKIISKIEKSDQLK